jgi:NCS2 family nucleobase:cation symporter-2
MANSNPGVAGAGLIFGSIIGAGVISILIAPIVSRMLRYFPPVVTGTIIAVIGISLMRIGINWIFGNPFGPTAPNIVNPEHAKWLADVGSLVNASVTAPAPAVAASAPAAAASALTAVPAIPKGLALVGTVPNPKYAQLSHMALPAWFWSPSC